jgi:dsDNA-specific endonuclease/ATPase MutS2
MRLTGQLPRQMPAALAMLDPEDKGLRTFYIPDSATPELLKLRAEKRRLEAAITASDDDEEKQRLRDDRLKVVCGEEDEELNIRKGLTSGLLVWADEFFANAYSIGRLDLLLQKGKLAAENQTTRPEFSDATVSFEEVYNPYIANILQKRGKEFTPPY